MSIILGQASTADISALVELRIGYLSDDFGALTEQQCRELSFQVPEYLRHNLGRDLFVYVARDSDDGCIASCAWLLLVDKPPSPRFPHGRTGTLFNVYTVPEWRHRGCARRVMELLIADARARALDVLELHATDEGYGLYRSLGFEDDSTTHVPMRLML